MLIVAGPSGAGKSAFLRELAAGRLPLDITRHLPEDARSWPEVWCNRPHEWQPYMGRERQAAKASGIAVHYDVTLKWMSLDEALQDDPFWELVQHCEAATVVNIRPSRRRLLRQWVHARLSLPSVWSVYRKRLLSALSHRALPALRILRTRRPNRRKPHANRYPRRIRFLKYWDARLEHLHFTVDPAFDLYCRPGALEQMLRSWDAVTADKLNGLHVRQIELAPSPDCEIDETFRWNVVAVDDAPKRASSPGRASIAPAMTVLAGSITAGL